MFTKADIEKYFLAEKQGSLIIFLVTIVFILAAILILIFLKSSFYKGLAIPLLFFGIIGGIGSFVVYKRSDGDRIKNVYAYDLDPSQLKNSELPRMKKVMKNFITLRYIELALALTGAGLFFYFRNNAGTIFWKGFGLSLAIFALIGLTADYFAEKRGHVYSDGLESFVSKK